MSFWDVTLLNYCSKIITGLVMHAISLSFSFSMLVLKLLIDSHAGGVEFEVKNVI